MPFNLSFNIQIIKRINGEQIEVYGFSVAEIKGNGRTANKAKVIGKFFDKR